MIMKDNIKANVGIITIHDSNNCGALLQAYALQRTIEKFGYSAEFIDHNRFSITKKELNQRIITKEKKISLRILFKKIMGINALKIDAPLRKAACENFRNTYLFISKRRYTEISEIQDEPPIYDAYVCGSDQIWNPERFRTSAPFFLSFAPRDAVKISYAPSLGVSKIPDSLHEGYESLVGRLNYVSVREENGAALISSIIGRKVTCVLDPTLLLEKNEWLSVFPERRMIEKQYVFCYFLNYMSAYRIRNELNAYARKHGLKVLMFQPKCASIDASWIPAYGLGPVEFLNAILHANLVITDSFHGTALSIKLERPFYVYSAESDLPFASRFDRIRNILEKCLLNDRILDLGQVIEDKHIDYNVCKSRLDLEIKRSLLFLENALSSVQRKRNSHDTFGLPFNQTSCYGCGLCSHICGHNALRMHVDVEGFYRPVYRQDLCVRCGLCENICPALRLPLVQTGSLKECYAAWNRDETVQKRSSSGGVFSALAGYVLKSGGLVLGASVSSKIIVRHIAIDEPKNIEKCCGSKYVQSSMEGVFEIVTEALHQNRMVLFTGTGCQVAAIRARFGEKRNLFLCDVVCHGVGSPRLFSDYLADIEKAEKKKVNSYCFRDESLGWNRPCVRIDFEDGSTDKHRWYKDMFILAFSKNKILRSSCYQCQYSSYPRMSDITIGDFWGAKRVGAIFNSKGTSLVILNSQKGKEMFDSLKGELICKAIEFDKAIKYNNSAISSIKKPNERDTIFYHYRKDGFKYIKKQYLMVPTISEKLKKKIVQFLGK